MKFSSTIKLTAEKISIIFRNVLDTCLYTDKKWHELSIFNKEQQVENIDEQLKLLKEAQKLFTNLVQAMSEDHYYRNHRKLLIIITQKYFTVPFTVARQLHGYMIQVTKFICIQLTCAVKHLKWNLKHVKYIVIVCWLTCEFVMVIIALLQYRNANLFLVSFLLLRSSWHFEHSFVYCNWYHNQCKYSTVPG